ncbi:MAG: hypothetical protein HY320_05465 [Armatimonadetes bacterium]|nr:hypothetical protein [Armatimonadota bacterium]
MSCRRGSAVQRHRTILAAGAWLALLASAAAGQEPSGTPGRPLVPGGNPAAVQASVEVGVGGRVRADVPIPVAVTLTNTGEAITDGRIEVASGEQRTRRAFNLPRQGQKRYLLFVRLPDLDYRARAVPDKLQVSLYDRGRHLGTQSVPMRFVSQREALIASLTDEGGGLVFLNQGAQFDYGMPSRLLYRLRAVHFTPEMAPRTWAEWAPVELLVVTGRAWEQLDAEQRQAIRRWTEQGGLLVACADLLTQWRDAEGARLLPLNPTALRSARSLPDLGGLIQAPLDPAYLELPLTLVVGRPRPGAERLLEVGGETLLARAPRVAGACLYLGFDPFQPALREWPGYEPFWRGLLHRLLAEPLPGSAIGWLDDHYEARDAASSLPPLRAPPEAVLVAFAVAYAAIFGPLNIWMLRRLRRTVRAWLFMPALALGMALVALVVGQSWGQARSLVNAVCVLETQSGARTAVGQTLAGIFSPTSRAFDVVVEDPASRFDPLEDATTASMVPSGPTAPPWPDTEDDREALYERQPLLQYSLRLLRVRRVADLGAGVEVTLSGRTGRVYNGTEFTLRRGYLYLPAPERFRSARVERYPLPDLVPGESVVLRADRWQPWAAPGATAVLPPSADERQAFHTRFQFLRENTPHTLLRLDRQMHGWLVAEAAAASTGLRVAGVPTVNQSVLILVRVPQWGIVGQ